MSTKHTPNYSLSQWQASDQVLRTDFNEDNAALEAALVSLEERVSLLDRAVPYLAYYAGQFALMDFAQRGKVLGQYALHYNDFQYTQGCLFTGGAQVVNGILKLEGSGMEGSFTSQNISLANQNWTRAQMWLRCDTPGEVVIPSINGVPMTFVSFNGTFVPSKNISAYERGFILEGSGSSAAQVRLDLNSGTRPGVQIYDYFIFFF